MSTSFTNIGNIHADNKNNDKALEYYFMSLEIDEKLNDKNRIAQDYFNIAICYDEKGEDEKAFDFFNKSLKIYEVEEDKAGVAAVLGSFGTYYTKKGDYNKAIENYFKALALKEEIGDKHGIALAYHDIGNLYIKQKRFPEAKKKLLLSLDISKEIESKPFILKAYRSLSTCDSIQGNFKSAYEFHHLYSVIKDSIYNQESNKAMTEMSTKYETEKKEQQIKLLNKDKEIQAAIAAAENRRNKIIIFSISSILLLVFGFALFANRQKNIIKKEKKRSDELLLNILPYETAEELKLNGHAEPRQFDMVTVLFTDFKGFTQIAENMSAKELVGELDFVFKKFDEIIAKYPIEKIKTIGDAYMCAGGLPTPNTTNSIDVTRAAVEIQQFIQSYNVKQTSAGKPVFEIRIGIHTGPIVAGIVGIKKFSYDIWGDTVNTASRMESSGEAGKINVSGSTYQLIKEHFKCEFRGKISAKNKGEIDMYFVS